MGRQDKRLIGARLLKWISLAPVSMIAAGSILLTKPDPVCISVTALMVVAIFDVRRRHRRAARIGTQLQAMLTSALDPLLACDPRGVILFASDSVQPVFGWSPEELVGRNVSCLMPEPYSSCHDGYLSEHRATGISRVMGQARQISGQRKDGSVFACEVSISPIRCSGSANQGYVGVLRDISKRLDDEQALQDAKREAEEANQAKTSFLANVSHELLTPLTSISAAGEILDRMPIDEDPANRKEFTQIIHKEALRMSRLVRELLDMANLEIRGTKLQLTCFDLRDLLQDSVAGVKSLALDKKLRLRVDAGREDARVHADRGRLQQALVNVLANGIKFSPVNSEILCIIKVDASEVTLRICDRGPGVPVESREQVFDKFYQCGDTLTDKPTGSGLGLAITREIMRRHDGDVICRGRLMGGAEFVLTLPRMKGSETPLEQQRSMLSSLSGA